MKSATVRAPSRSRRARRWSSRLRMKIGRLRLAPQRPEGEADAEQHHGQRQELAHGGARQHEREKGVGLAEELGDDARDAVADHEGAGDETENGRASCRERVCQYG